MSAGQLADWWAYYRVEPFGEERADLRFGVAFSRAINAIYGPKKPFAPEDFMPCFELQEAPVENDHKALSQALRAAFESLKKSKRKE